MLPHLENFVFSMNLFYGWLQGQSKTFSMADVLVKEFGELDVLVHVAMDQTEW